MTLDINSLELKDHLNDDIWDPDDNLYAEIRQHLLKVAKDFFEDLDIPWATLEDVRFTGSLANYNWSKYSDIDLHLVVDYSLVDENIDLVESFFNARKNLWNNAHDITIHGFDVEVYVEDLNEVHLSTGVYSVLHDEWIKKPKATKPIVDKYSIKKKAKTFMKLIDKLVVDNFQEKKYNITIEAAEFISDRLRKMRSCGLEKGGEYSVENLTYKILRRNGTLDRLRQMKLDAYDNMMSIE